MVQGAITRLTAAAGAMAVAVALAVGVSPTAALAAPKVAKPTNIHVVGKGITGTLNGMANAKPQTTAPRSDKRGPKYTLTVLTRTTPMQVYDLYPLASGGPRAHRPAKQFSANKTDGWFYGRLTMSETLRVSGVPLKPKPDVVNGGIGGGIGRDLSVEELDPVAGMNEFVVQMRRLLLLNGAVLVVILFGLASIAFLIRRRV